DVRTCRKRAAGRGALVHAGLPAARAETVRTSADGSRPGYRAFARCPSPPDADRGRAPRTRAGTLPAVLAGGCDSRRKPARLRTDPKTFRDPACGGGDVQLDLGLQAPHRAATHRLHTHDHRARG